MRQRGRLIAAGAAALVALLLVGGVWLLIFRPWRQAQRFPDGTVLTLEGSTYQKHWLTVSDGWKWWTPARQLLLPRDRQHSANGMALWFTAADGTGGRGLAVVPGGFHPWELGVALTAQAVDEHGDRIGPLHRSWPAAIPGQNRWLTVWLDAFPRRGRIVRVQYFRPGSSEPAAEFAVDNPTPGPHPVWTAEPYPIRKNAGDLTCILEKLVTGFGHRQLDARAAPGESPYTRATFRFEQEGKPTVEWQPVGITVSDATGNVLSPWDGFIVRRGKAQELQFAAALSPRESAWKLRVELCRTARARFAPQETWTVQGLRVPARNEVISSTATTRLLGTQIQIQELTGPDNAWLKPRVRVQVRNPRKGYRLTLRATDEHGRTFAGYGTSSSARQQLGGMQCDFFLNLPPDSRTLDLTLALSRSRFLELLARPAEL
ncbi:MAG: hypothetical protein ACK47B_11555 [Armatimonadota bacterium]